MRAVLHLISAGLLVLMAVSHGLGTPDAISRLEQSDLGSSFVRSLTVLWLNGALLPAVLATVLVVGVVQRPRSRRLAWVVAGVTALQAVGAGYVAGPTFFGVWVIAAACLAIVVAQLLPERPDRSVEDALEDVA